MPDTAISRILKNSTREIHASIESTPFAQAVLKKEITIEAYLGFIRVLAVIHSALEGCLSNCSDQRILRIWSIEMQRSPLLNDDNDFFRWDLIPESPEAVKAALEAAAHIRQVAGNNPIALAGAVYVLMGSTKGAVILLPLIAKTLNLTSDKGLSYLSCHGGQGPEQWDAASAVMDEVITDPDEIKAAQDTALLIFRKLDKAFKAVFPLQPAEMKYCATGFNPESGNHPVPQNKLDLVAVLRASDACLSEYPYFIYRYGKRGRRYTDADGAWLTTAAELEPETMQSQAGWLAGVLSSRGMPSILLARHLEILSRELSFIQKEDDYRISILTAAARSIGDNLENNIPGNMRKLRAEAMEQSLGRKNDFCCHEALDLISSAVVDEANGIKNAIESLMLWLIDPKRFSKQWIQVLKDEVEYLRTAID